MSQEFSFYPARGSGLIFHGAVAAILLGVGGYGLWQATRAQVGPVFLLYLVPSLVAAILLPILAFRIYALWKAGYTLERDGIRLQWGLRSEDIPIDEVLWMRLSRDYPTRLPLPVIRWPGSVLGTRRLRDGMEVEYLATRGSRLVLIGTPRRIYAISPAQSEEFLSTFRRFVELGSLAPVPSRSVYPSLFLARFWQDLPARFMLLLSILLTLGLLAGVSLVIPGRERVPIRLDENGLPVDYVPAVQLLLLPVINAFFFATDLTLGLFFYRGSATRPLAYLMWSSSIVASLLFLGAVFFIVRG